MNVSTLSGTFATSLLSSPTLPSLIKLNSQRLSESYTLITTFFKERNIEWLPCNATPFVLAKIVPKAKTWEEEVEVIEELKGVGMLVGDGRRYHVQEPGWARITFAVPREVLVDALEKLGRVWGIER
jgi:gliotoxin/aspirochlorine biosynthesis aminotransferase